MSISTKIYFKASNHPKIAKHLSNVKIAWANIFYSENPDKIRESAVFVADQIFVASPDSRIAAFNNKKATSYKRFLGESLKTFWVQRYSAKEIIQVALNSKKPGPISMTTLELCEKVLSLDPHDTWKAFIAGTIIPYIKSELCDSLALPKMDMSKDPVIER
ncbi:MAG: hypothetical protein NT030_00835 [Candidatus Saganbacteria bacterium]|nr:hypothetical protein [Candidatus Saganbacteria bacterium]